MQTGPQEWHRAAVGGMWEEVGKLQFDFMVSLGLQPRHRLLDIGCGSLRGGVHFIGYLEPGHYVGVDPKADLLARGQLELQRAGLVGRGPVLVQRDDFDVASLGTVYDYALAHSVFTHLPLNALMRCVAAVGNVLAPGGTFYATFFEQRGPRLSREPASQGGREPAIMTTMDADPFHYDPDIFRWMCEGSDLSVELVGDWGHPRNQRMLAFVKGA